MTFVVLPLSAITGGRPGIRHQSLTGPIGHMFLVGLPIALAVKRFS